MLAASTGRAGRCWLLQSSVLIAFGSTLCVAAQTAAPAHANSASRPPVLPRMCLVQRQPSEKIKALLDTIQDHPTAGAYNTLGVLYAQKDRLSCAIPAFEASFQLDGQNWEAHYNLALALLRKGDRPRATRELRTAIQQKPDSVSSRFALGSVLKDEKKLG